MCNDLTWMVCRPVHLRTYGTARMVLNLVRHRINDVVHTDSNAQGGEFLGVLGVVGVLPGVAQVHVMTDGYDEPAAVVVDAAPAGYISTRSPIGIGPALFANAPGLHVLHAGHLVAIVQVEYGVEDGVGVLDFHDGPVRKHLRHTSDEIVPFVGAVK